MTTTMDGGGEEVYRTSMLMSVLATDLSSVGGTRLAQGVNMSSLSAIREKAIALRETIDIDHHAIAGSTATKGVETLGFLRRQTWSEPSRLSSSKVEA